MITRTLTLSAVAFMAGVAIASAQPAPGQDPHHPGTDPSSAQTKPVPTPPQRPAARGPMQSGMPMQPGGPGMMMGGDMSQMMAMMQMMQSGMMPMGMGPRAGRDPFQHVEGQIAFYKAELEITDAQATQWNAFADALRSNAAKLRQTMMQAREAQGTVSAPEQMERRIAMLTGLRDAMQAMLTAAKPLYAVLNDDQMKSADDLMAEHMMSMRARGL
jgi:hypothetical protein